MESPSDLRRVLILDTETSGLDPATGHLLEVAVAGYDIKHGLLNAHSWLCRAPTNEAHVVNGIPVELVQDFGIPTREKAQETVGACAMNFDAVVAHNVEFDRKWTGDLGKQWICTDSDVEWPLATPDRKLGTIHKKHLGYDIDGHRALADVATLIRLFDWVRTNGHDLGAMLARGLRPKARFVHRSPWQPDKDKREAANRVLKDNRFRWDPDAKEWFRMMPPEDAAGFPFDVKEVA